jgi:hypothetical protein
VNALKPIDMEKFQKAEIATLSIKREAMKHKRAQKRRKEDQDGPDDPEYGAGKQ